MEKMLFVGCLFCTHRSIAMTVPNNEQIAEVLLVSEGFKHAKVLARKLVSWWCWTWCCIILVQCSQ